MKTFLCDHCSAVVFFENVVCGNCGSALGFIPEELDMGAFEPGATEAAGAWRRAGQGEDVVVDAWLPCRNYAMAQVCNWMVAPTDGEPLCLSCRHTAPTAALDEPDNRGHWFKLEAAKRLLFYSLFRLGLPLDPGPRNSPLVFRFLDGEAQPVTIGHAGGTITLDLAEADDAQREARRLALKEPYRTLLGHFRHEVGHYYWERLVADSVWIEPFRKLFGDERKDYGEALEAYYAVPPPADWPQRYISAYATMHPWEDWAETWAHYLHIVEALDTAAHWGFALNPERRAAAPAHVPEVTDEVPFQTVLVEQWLPLSQFLNSMGRSLGQGDSYPFVIAPEVLRKLCFVHELVISTAAETMGDSVSGEVGA